MSAARACLAAILLVATGGTGTAGASPALDAFVDAGAWSAVASDQVEATLRRPGEGTSLCLDFDFHGVSGYAGIRRELAIDYPENYEFAFRVRGETPPNALQFKLGDASGDNVWWVNRPQFEVTREWRDVRYRKREVAFAWGPNEDRALRHSETIEFTLYAGSGGRGEVCFDSLDLHALRSPPAAFPALRASATSTRRDAPVANSVDGKAETAWRSSGRGTQVVTLDLGLVREFGAIVLHWSDGEYASHYDVDLSDDRRHWTRARSVSVGNGGDDPLYLPESEARYIRLVLHEGPARDYALSEIEIKDIAFGASVNEFFATLAKQTSRGAYPRAFHAEQTYWTVLGIDGGHDSGLLSEDGAIEVARGGFSIEPFLVDERGALTSWADVAIKHSLEDGYLPIPSVSWQRDELLLTVNAFARRLEGDGSQLLAGYTIDNASDQARSITLALAIRPFQVNPSVQFLNTPGGVSPIRDLAWNANDATVLVNGKPHIHALSRPERFAARAFDAGMIMEHLAQARTGDPANEHPLHDDTGLASGALLYRIQLPARANRTIVLSMPLDGKQDMQAPVDVPAWFAAQRKAAAFDWHQRLDGVGLRLPPQAQSLADALRTALAHILISRDGPALRPGTRSYARSWIRDGAMMSEALLRLGRADVARDYLEWYAPYQFASGKVPCCVDQRGSDPVAENDSHGELIHLAWDTYRYAGDRAVLENAWPHVDAATRYMDRLRASESGDAGMESTKRSLRGLMPASISHEGYSAKPMHSYWDDFWALLGYKDAVAIAATLDRPKDVARLRASRDAFRTDLYASLDAAMHDRRIAWIPGCAELGDFDATSTTIALSPAGEQAMLPQEALHATFERYWQDFVARRDGATAWKDYTPYEWRAVGTFVRLGWRERALAAIDFFMRDRRPVEWNQWAEVVGKDARESRFVGDMPHGWVASDFIRSALDLFAYERETDSSLVLAAGVPDSWLVGDGVAIDGLHTPYGRLSWSLHAEGTRVRLHVDRTDLRIPPGGLVYAPDYRSGSARLDGRRVSASNGEFRIRSLPADLTIERAGVKLVSAGGG
jgi:hypothetical protein